jgi:large subunit ribosomal protein L19e|tara:strand:+ start:547 stop:963 length:417 start_codon:yes stop_codon:yes gene_type:complete
MQLNKKKELASRVLGIGKKRIIFNKEALDEVKEALTKQDIKDLVKAGSIFVKEISGTKKQVKRNTRRRAGSIKKNVNTRKRDYMTITRKLRAFISELRKHGTISSEEYWKLRKEIRAKSFKSKAHLKERISQVVKERK